MNSTKFLLEVKKIADMLSKKGHVENKIVITNEEGEITTSNISEDKLEFLANVESDIKINLDEKLDVSGHELNKIVITNEEGMITTSDVNPMALDNIKNVERDIQEQLDEKLNLSGYKGDKIIGTNEIGNVFETDVNINIIQQNVDNIARVEEDYKTEINTLNEVYEPRITQVEEAVEVMEKHLVDVDSELVNVNVRIDNIDGVDNIEGFVKDIETLKEEMTDIKLISYENTNDIAHLTEICKNVREYGVEGNGIANDTEPLQAILSDGGNIYIPEGEYILSDTLTIKSNTTLIMSSGAILKKQHNKTILKTDYNENTTGYLGSKNIKILGGVLDCNNGVIGADVVELSHAENIEIKGIKIKNTLGGSAIHLIGCRNVNIENNIIEGYEFSEDNIHSFAIKISACTYMASPVFVSESSCFDGTVCENINIINNKIGASNEMNGFFNGIGNSQSFNLFKKHNSINICNNIIFGMNKTTTLSSCYGAVMFTQVDNLNIENNIIDGFSSAMFMDIGTTCYDIKSTEAKEINITDEATESVFGLSNVIISNNKIYAKKLSDRKLSGIWLNIANIHLNKDKYPKHYNCNIVNNIITTKDNIDISCIVLESCVNVIVSENNINGTSATIGINVLHGSENTTIKNNNIVNIKEENQLKILSGLSGIKVNKRLLWTGQMSELNSKATLVDEISNYDVLLVESSLQGTQFDYLRFDDTSPKSLRAINLADSMTTLTISFYEMNLKKLDDKTIELSHNKKQDLDTSGLKPAVASTAFIRKIYGINY